MFILKISNNKGDIISKDNRFPTTNINEFVAFLFIIFFIYLGMYIVFWGGFEFICFIWDPNARNGINWGFWTFIIIIIAALIIAIFIYNKKSNKNYEKLKEKWGYIGSEVYFLSRNKKKLFTKTYNIPNNNEDILNFIYKNWVSNNDDEDEITSLIFKLSSFNRSSKDTVNSTLKNTLPKSFINKVLVRDNYICQKCGKNLLDFETKEHLSENDDYIDLIKPISKGGTLTEDNLITSCKKSCEEVFIPTKALSEIYENTKLTFGGNHLTFKKDEISFEYPDSYSIANIPENCPDCIVALAKKDGRCDIMIEMGGHNFNFNRFIFEFPKYVNGLEGFFDIEEIDLEKIYDKNNKYYDNISEIYCERDNKTKACFIATAKIPSDSKINGFVKSIIYFDNQSHLFRITLNTLIDDDYNCMNDLYIIAETITYDYEPPVYDHKAMERKKFREEKKDVLNLLKI